MTEPNEVPAGPGQEQSEDEPSLAGELNIGPRVTAVFTAAERAAQHIVTMAREEADDLRRRAEAEAESLLSQRRYLADEEASRRIADAQTQADQIRTAAEEEARQIEETAHRRELRVREETRLLEERVEWAREGLREVAERIRDTEMELGDLPVAAPRGQRGPSRPNTGPS
jgi:cell division septum initiation protein DivIVA